MSQTRRKFLAAIGLVATGGGIAVGTGAYDSLDATRTSNVTVTGDADGLLGLHPGDNSLVYYGDDDTLELDLSEVNYDSLLQIDSAFTITNGLDGYAELELELDYGSDVASDEEEDVQSALTLSVEDAVDTKDLTDDNVVLEMDPADDFSEYTVDLEFDGEYLADNTSLQSGDVLVDELQFHAYTL